VSDPTYTPDPADVELVADALARRHAWDGLPDALATRPEDAEWFRDCARAVLAALAAAGRLQPEPTEIRIECEVDWVDVRGTGRDAYGITYEWRVAEFDARLAREFAAAERLHRAPVLMRKRTVSTFPDGSTLLGPWLPVPEPTCTCPDCDVSTVGERPGTSTIKGLDPACRIHGKLDGWCACKPGDTCGYHLANPRERP
jgi:hypothetical protein